MADVKKLQTRIALKYDSYENWLKTDVEGKGGNLVLLAGELGICEIPGTVKSFVENGKTVTVETAPTVLFKVGGAKNEDGSLKAFKDLPWASAKAADVYDWAKKSEEEFKTWLSETAAFATDAEVKDITDGLASRIAGLEEVLGETGDVTEALADLNDRLETIEGNEDTTGSVLNAIKVANAYADSLADNYDVVGAAADVKEEVIGASTDAKTADTIYGAKAFATDLNTAMNTRVEDLETASAAHTEAIGDENSGLVKAIADEKAARELGDENITKAIGTSNDVKGTATVYGAIATEKDAREQADLAINNKIGTLPTGEGAYTTIVAGIADAKKAGTDAAQAIVDLTNGAVADNASAIAGLRDEFEAHVEAQTEADYDGRLEKIEAFFKGAAEDETVEGELINALDTLKEIQEFATGEGTAATEMLNAIQANADAIEDNADAIDTLANASTGRVTLAESAIAAIEDEFNTGRVKEAEDDIDALEAEFAAEGRVTVAEAAIEALAKAETGRVSIAESKIAALEAEFATEGRVTVAEAAIQDIVDTIGDANDGLVKAIADNATAIAGLQDEFGDEGRVTELEEAVDALEILTAGFGEGETVRGKINDAATLGQTGIDNAATAQAAAEAADAKAQTAQDEVDALEIVVSGTDGKGGVKATAEDAQSRVAAIEEDYLKAADLFIFDCGSSTEVVHTEA